MNITEKVQKAETLLQEVRAEISQSSKENEFRNFIESEFKSYETRVEHCDFNTGWITISMKIDDCVNKGYLSTFETLHKRFKLVLGNTGREGERVFLSFFTPECIYL